MAEEPRIHSWPCCYYLDSSRQWIPGKLSLTPVSLRFTADGSGELLVDSRLSGIAAIRKESSLLLFRALTVLERGAKHWFGSVRPSRNAAFTVLEHFWRQQLLPAGSGAGAGAGKGRELVGMLAGSQRSLEATAQALHSQGEQFDGILRGLHKIEGDMDVADRLLTELESPSWWPFSGKLWKTAPEAKPKEASPKETPAPEEEREILLRIPVILTGGGDRGAAKAAALTVLPSGLEIRDGNSQLLHRFASRDVDDIRVHTPYELSVRQRFIGKPDHSCRLLAARMPEAIPVLAARFPGKLQFLEDALGFAGAAKSPQGDLGASLWQAASGFLAGAGNSGCREGPEQGQLQEHEKVSQEEANELRQILQKLKGLALETEAELERQDEALDSISSSVDRATLNIDRQNRRIRRLT